MWFGPKASCDKDPMQYIPLKTHYTISVYCVSSSGDQYWDDTPTADSRYVIIHEFQFKLNASQMLENPGQALS